MFIASAERGEISLVEVNVTERQMQRWINDTDEMAQNRH
jgi:ABC-type xylose transport system substrate-binding protein